MIKSFGKVPVKCKKCGEKDEVPGYVIDKFAMGKDFKKEEMPGVACPECGAEMKFKYSLKEKNPTKEILINFYSRCS